MARVASFYDHPDIIAEALDVMSVKTEQPIPILELMLETQQLLSEVLTEYISTLLTISLP